MNALRVKLIFPLLITNVFLLVILCYFVLHLKFELQDIRSLVDDMSNVKLGYFDIKSNCDEEEGSSEKDLDWEYMMITQASP